MSTFSGIECGSVNDEDCVPGLSDGSGPGLNINANLILGNAAESGSGGGIRFQAVNGTEVTRFPNSPQNWYAVNVSNNIIVNNVAGWDGAGVGAARRAGGEFRQQHDRFQRHHRVGGNALQRLLLPSWAATSLRRPAPA